METVKRVYTKPTILKVQLSHEQAILATCSSKTTSASSGGTGCKPSCRSIGGGGSDAGPTS
jgi:hypothetical protein